MIGVVAGLATLGLLAFFVLRRRRRANAQDLEASRLNQNKPSEALSAKPSNNYLHHLGPLNSKPSGLDWKDGDEIKSAQLPHRLQVSKLVWKDLKACRNEGTLVRQRERKCINFKQDNVNFVQPS